GRRRLDAIAAGLAPSPRSGLGLSVVHAVAGPAGRRGRFRRAGRAATGHAMIGMRSSPVAPPGRVPLGPMRFSLIDVPDLELLPRLWPQLHSVWVGVAVTPGLVRRALNFLAWSVRLRLLPSLTEFVPLMHRVSRLLRWGEHRSGMFVALEGADATGRKIERSWHVIAEGDDGPFIPAMAAAAIIRRRVYGRGPHPGARVAAGEVELADYELQFAGRNILTGVREEGGGPVYRRLLGDAYETLPAPIRAMHD